jgi:hypothetical protein
MDRRGGQAVARKLLQIALASLALIGFGWQRHVAGAAQRRALT